MAKRKTPGVRWILAWFVFLAIIVIVAFIHGPDPEYVLHPIWQECQIVAEGEGVEQTAPYEGQGIHSIILLQSSGKLDSWSDSLPREWWPTNITEVQLVVLVERDIGVIEVCEYAPGPDIRRIQNFMVVELREAKTGELVDNTTLFGSVPPKCKQWAPLGKTRLEGSMVSTDQLIEWLEKYVVTND